LLDGLNDALAGLRNSFRDLEHFVQGVQQGVDVLRAAEFSEAEMFKAIQKSLEEIESSGTAEDAADLLRGARQSTGDLKDMARSLREELGV
jgi:hypothetical protein